ncbi:MAG: flagellar motor protein MotB [Bdellovibrionales bacterium]
MTDAEEVIENPASISKLSIMNKEAADKKTKKTEDEKVETPLWLITFTDIMALMLTFFVLLYSMSVPEVKKWEDLSTSINEGFSKFYSPQKFAGAQDTLSIDKIDRTQALNLNYLRDLIEVKMKEDELLGDVKIISAKDKIIISLPEDLLFEGGDNDVTTQGKRALFSLGGLLARIRNRVEVVGHSDPRPITNPNAKFASNWELSLARAASVSNVLLQVGYVRDVITRGMSSARYDELPETLPEQTRLDLSRRVDIVVMKDDGGKRSILNFGQ